MFVLPHTLPLWYPFITRKKVKVKLLSPVWLFATPWTIQLQGILQARMPELTAFPFSRGAFPTQGPNPGLPHCRWILCLRYQKGGATDPSGVTFFLPPPISQVCLHRQMQRHFSAWCYIFPWIYGILIPGIYFKLLASPLFFGYRSKLETKCEAHQRLSWLHTRITWEILNTGA